jgi:hypothetical protein
MGVHYEKVLAAAKAAYPELWPEDPLKEADMPRGPLAFARQDAIERVGRALEAYENVKPEVGAGPVVLMPPEDAALVQQVLAVTSYIDNTGRTTYSVRCIGEGLSTTWLGMGVLAQNWLLQNFSGLS